jgi:phosphatidylinositol glycan class A protein
MTPLLQVRLDWKTGVAATDWDNIAKRDKVDAMSMSLRELEAEIKEIHEGMLYFRKREEEMRDINENTNSRVAWLSVSSLGICVGMSVWQLVYLKSFFVRKKLL